MSVSLKDSPSAVQPTKHKAAKMTAHQRRTFLVTCIGSFMVILDVSIVNTALPSIQRDFHSSFSSLQWVVDAYALSFAVLLLSFGALSDRYGRKRLFQLGMAVFILGSLLCGLAQSTGLLNASRALQGMGAAALAPSSLALLATAFPDAHERVRAISLWSAISFVALGVGPTVGGALVVSAGWRWVFFMNVPIGALCLLFGVRALKESRDPVARKIDLPGQLLSVVWVGALAYGFIERGSHSWTSTSVAIPLVVAVVFLASFLVVEHHSKDPMLPLSLFRVRLFSSAAIVTLLFGSVLLSVPFFAVQYLQNVHHESAFNAGLKMLAFTLMLSSFSPIAGKLARRFGFRVPIALGGLIAGTGLILLSTIKVTTSFATLGWHLAVIGIGFALMVSPLQAAALSAVDARRAGLASSVANATRQVGTVIGIALFGAVVETRSTAVATKSLVALPHAAQSALANVLGHGGANAPLPSVLPKGLTAVQLHTISASSYVAGVHLAYLIAGFVLFGAAVVAATSMHPKAAAIVVTNPVSATEASDLEEIVELEGLVAMAE